jgi:hypothetical protein
MTTRRIAGAFLAALAVAAMATAAEGTGYLGSGHEEGRGYAEEETA